MKTSIPEDGAEHSGARSTDRESGIGILAIGTYLPAEVRRNDWWPSDIVARWGKEAPRGEARPVDSDLTPEQRIVLEAQSEVAADPFRGAIERRIMPADMTSLEMEVEAARQAIDVAGVSRRRIDLLLVHTLVPDDLALNTAALLHERLGLQPSCYSLSTEGAHNSFLLQLALAEAMILAGQASVALLVQSCAASRILPYDEPYSTQFGDGATAVLVTRVGKGRGVLASAHRTDGSRARALVAGVPGREWYSDGRCIIYSRDLPTAHRLLLDSAGLAKDVVHDALDRSRLAPESVAFFACHQATAWLRKAVQTAAGLVNAAARDNFSMTGSLYACNVPLALATGWRDGILRPDDIVMLFAGGSGATFSGTVLRWGA